MRGVRAGCIREVMRSSISRRQLLGSVTSGCLALAAARVKGTISGHGRGDKVIVFKFKRKKQYKRTIGHRQNFTRVKIDEISAA